MAADVDGSQKRNVPHGVSILRRAGYSGTLS